MDDYNDRLLSQMASATKMRQTQPVQAQLSPGNFIFQDDPVQPSDAAVNGDGSPSTQSSSYDMLTELNGGGAQPSAVNGSATTRVNGSTTQTSIFATAVASGGAADVRRPTAVRVGGSSNVGTSRIFGMEDSDEYDNNEPQPPPSSSQMTLPNASSTHLFRPLEPAVASQHQNASPYTASRAARLQEEAAAANPVAPATTRRVETEGVEASRLFNTRLFNANAGASNGGYANPMRSAATTQKKKKMQDASPYVDPMNAINPGPETYRSFTAGPQQHKADQRSKVPAWLIWHPQDGRPEPTGNWKVLAEELLCTLNSGAKTWKTAADIAINIDEDTGLPADWLRKRFNKPDFERLLQAEELKDYVRWRHRDGKAEYAAVPVPRIAHICAEVSRAERFATEKNVKHDERKHAKACEPAFQAEILEAKQKIAALLQSMNVETGAKIAYKKLQDAYQDKHGIPLDAKEIKKLFKTPQAKKAFCIYCLDEFEVHDGDSGTWHIKMKMTLEDMQKFHKEQSDLRLNNPRRLGANFMRNRSEYKGGRAENKERLVEERVAHVIDDPDMPSTSAQAAARAAAASSARPQSFLGEPSASENRRQSESQQSSSSPPLTDADRHKTAQERANKQKEKEKKASLKTGYTTRPTDGDYTSTDDSSDEEEDETGLEAQRPTQNVTAVCSAAVSDAPIPPPNGRSSVAADYERARADVRPSAQVNGVKSQRRASTTASQRVRRITDSSSSDDAEEESAVNRAAPRTMVRVEETTEGFGSRRRADASGGVHTSNGYRYDSPVVVEQRREPKAQPQVQQPPRTVDTGNAVEANGTAGHGANFLQMSVQRSGRTVGPAGSGQSLPTNARASAAQPSPQVQQKSASSTAAPAAPSGRDAEFQAQPRSSDFHDYSAPQADDFRTAAPHSSSSRAAEFTARSAATRVSEDISTASGRPANVSRDSIFSNSRSPPVAIRDGLNYDRAAQQSVRRTDAYNATNGYNTVDQHIQNSDRSDNARGSAAPRSGTTDRAPTRAHDAPARSVPIATSQLRSEAAIDDRDEARRDMIRNMAECYYPDVISVLRIEESLAHLNLLPHVPLVDFIRTVPNVDVFEHYAYWYCKSFSSPSGQR